MYIVFHIVGIMDIHLDITRILAAKEKKFNGYIRLHVSKWEIGDQHSVHMLAYGIDHKSQQYQFNS